MRIDPQAVYTRAEVSRIFRVEPATVARWEKTRGLRASRTGHRTVRYLGAHLLALLESTEPTGGTTA